MKTIKYVLVLGSLMLLISACSNQDTVAEVNLEGVTWVLTGYNDIQPIEGREPTIQFAQGQVSGNTGCNHYGGSYQVNGDEIHFGDLFNTEMACIDPDGLMEQEQAYLELVRGAERFELVEGGLTIFNGAQQRLVFAVQPESPSTAEPALEQPTPAAVTQVAAPTDTPVDIPTDTPGFTPPAGFSPYQDPETGVTVYIPESWVVTGIVTGQYAIFQSYPEDKYVGGEALQAGDTKCDLNIRPVGSSPDELVQQWQTDAMTTIVSSEQITLGSGLPGARYVIDSMGRATVFMTEINQRVVLLTCFGDFTPVNAIAATLGASP